MGRDRRSSLVLDAAIPQSPTPIPSPQPPGRSMKPNRAVVALIVIVLALTTALTLVGTAVTLADTPAAAGRSTADIEVVRRFYDAVNTAIATGDLTALDAVVGPDL